MTATDTQTSRRSAFKSMFAAIAAASAGLFGITHPSRAEASGITRISDDTQPPGTQPPMFSSSVVHGGLVFVAGKGEHGPGDITVHTTSVLNQLEAELKKAGSSMDKVLKVNVYLHDIRDYEGMNAVYRGRFGAKPPVRSTIACYGGVPGQSLVEIDCIAAI
ncbi:MAG: RidA family protein [Vicinamibacterales bacterium]